MSETNPPVGAATTTTAKAEINDAFSTTVPAQEQQQLLAQQVATVAQHLTPPIHATTVIGNGASATENKWSKNGYGQPCPAPPSGGKFSPSETLLVRQSIEEYCAVHNITTARLCSECDHKAELKGAWMEIAKRLPHRTVQAVYRHGLRQLHPFKRGPWTTGEVQILMELVTKLGKKWSNIQVKLNRSADSCRDKYREMSTEYVKGRWKEGETEILKRLVREHLRVDPNADVKELAKMVELEGIVIPWSTISKRMGKRSRLSCFKKWQKMTGTSGPPPKEPGPVSLDQRDRAHGGGDHAVVVEEAKKRHAEEVVIQRQIGAEEVRAMQAAAEAAASVHVQSVAAAVAQQQAAGTTAVAPQVDALRTTTATTTTRGAKTAGAAAAAAAAAAVAAVATAPPLVANPVAPTTIPVVQQPPPPADEDQIDLVLLSTLASCTAARPSEIDWDWLRQLHSVDAQDRWNGMIDSLGEEDDALMDLPVSDLAKVLLERRKSGGGQRRKGAAAALDEVQVVEGDGEDAAKIAAETVEAVDLPSAGELLKRRKLVDV